MSDFVLSSKMKDITGLKLGGYVAGNVVPCCKKCNMSKSDMNQQDFYNYINKVYKSLLAKGLVDV